MSLCCIDGCDERNITHFLCVCGSRKNVCENHRAATREIRQACELQETCLKCKQPPIDNVTVKSKNDVVFSVCGECALELIDPFWADQYKSEQEEFEVGRASQGKQCDKCYTEIKPLDNGQGDGWTWTSENHIMYDHNYCQTCVNFHCSAYIRNQDTIYLYV